MNYDIRDIIGQQLATTTEARSEQDVYLLQYVGDTLTLVIDTGDNRVTEDAEDTQLGSYIGEYMQVLAESKLNVAFGPVTGREVSYKKLRAPGDDGILRDISATAEDLKDIWAVLFPKYGNRLYTADGAFTKPRGYSGGKDNKPIVWELQRGNARLTEAQRAQNAVDSIIKGIRNPGRNNGPRQFTGIR